MKEGKKRKKEDKEKGRKRRVGDLRHLEWWWRWKRKRKRKRKRRNGVEGNQLYSDCLIFLYSEWMVVMDWEEEMIRISSERRNGDLLWVH